MRIHPQEVTTYISKQDTGIDSSLKNKTSITVFAVTQEAEAACAPVTENRLFIHLFTLILLPGLYGLSYRHVGSISLPLVAFKSGKSADTLPLS